MNNFIYKIKYLKSYKILNGGVDQPMSQEEATPIPAPIVPPIRERIKFNINVDRIMNSYPKLVEDTDGTTRRYRYVKKGEDYNKLFSKNEIRQRMKNLIDQRRNPFNYLPFQYALNGKRLNVYNYSENQISFQDIYDNYRKSKAGIRIFDNYLHNENPLFAENYYSGRFNPPKGGISNEDLYLGKKTYDDKIEFLNVLFRTATRELREETGINLVPGSAG